MMMAYQSGAACKSEDFVPLALTAVGLSLAFKMRFWNIGAEGQVLIGCLASTTCMICLGGKMPNWLLLVVMTVASLAAGALWGFLPGFFKAKWNTNETLFTLMMNYIATQLAAFFIIVWEVPKGSGKIGIINQNTALSPPDPACGDPHGRYVHLSQLQQARL